jgi:hypothetical protein
MVFDEHPVWSIVASAAIVAALAPLSTALNSPLAWYGLLVVSGTAAMAVGRGVVGLAQSYFRKVRPVPAERLSLIVSESPAMAPEVEEQKGQEVLFAERVLNERADAMERGRLH